VTAEIVTGLSTRFDYVKVEQQWVYGRVITNGGQAVPSGAVVATGRDANGKEIVVQYAPIQHDGQFVIDVRTSTPVVDCYYTGAPGYADCDTVARG
jgi:hypothetical protein